MRFYNVGADAERNFWQVMLWLMGYYKDQAACTPPPNDFSITPLLYKGDGKAELTWIGHSSFYVAHNNIRFLIDPVWAERASPFRFLGPKRHKKPGICFEKLPPIDYILISHNHYDHLDLSSCKTLQLKNPKAVFIVPLGVKESLFECGITNVHEMDWWSTYENGPFRITAVPSQHFSGRGLFDRSQSLWCGYVVECADKCLYYSGDTGYNEYYFREIGSRFSHIDLSILPIGAYAPREFMKAAHVNPQEAIQIHDDVRSKASLGCHFGTFKLSDEPLTKPPYDLFLALQQNPRPFYLVQEGKKIHW
ncbi:MAG: MBL fold metallo-hydrolase [Verrucomicrobia bacterium]|nr:MBL fold metallo-hydrolase [Verrucomicrobiota bacterium]MBS0637461.1 MBL fold metallo-hydrolase [Verrucomicrobiota bacterium]